MSNKTIAAVVVTYNRLSLLKKCILSLKEQSHNLDCIIVVNNSSSDGTKEWLDLQPGIIVINQGNVGGSGGFYTGIKLAYENGYDFIWCMDDDVYPEKYCLHNLLQYGAEKVGILCPQRVIDNQICFGETLSFNLTNPFRPLKTFLSDFHNKGDTIEIQGMTFEGPLIKSEVIKTIGYPKKDLFILWDDSDYSYRAFCAGFKIHYIPTATLYKHNLTNNNIKIIKKDWKAFYGLRNSVYFTHKYGKNCLFRLVFPLLIFFRHELGIVKHLVLQSGKYQLIDMKQFWIAFKEGLKNNFVKSN